jgi:hypothetical protein
MLREFFCKLQSHLLHGCVNALMGQGAVKAP